MNLPDILKTEQKYEILIGLILVLLFFAAQLLLYFKSYLQCDESRKNGGTGRRDKESHWIYWAICLPIDIFNFFIVLCGKSTWGSIITCDNVNIVMPIITTILISFFGLTAASYTFQINDMHEQQRQFPNDRFFIDIYLERTRFKFSVALWSTVLICILSVSIFMLEGLLGNRGISNYKLECGFILCMFSTELILWMLYLNWVLFFHERYIDKYTGRILKNITDSSNNNDKLAQLLKRVNSLEMIFQRILQNNVHVQDVYPLADRALLAMLGTNGPEDTENAADRENAENLLKSYYELINWRNAVIHLENSRNAKRKPNLLPGPLQINMLEKIETHIRQKRMTNERFTNMDLSSMTFLGESNLKNTDFSGCDLRNINLEGSDCSGANFTDALMSRIYLSRDLDEKRILIDRRTKLGGANFYNCNLGNSIIRYEKENKDAYFDMEEGNFNRAVLTSSEMQGVNFELSSFDQAKLYYNKWKSCCAKLVIFSEAMFSNSLLLNTDFTKADFSGAFLVNAVIKDCYFEGARLHKTDFSNSRICGGNWSKIMATGAAFKNTKISPAVTEEELSEIRYQKPLFCRSVLRNVDFTESMLSCVDMSDAQVSECIFTGSTGNRNCFCNADMTNCLFNQTRWNRCFFDYVQFDRSVFKNVEFANGCFVRTSFEQCLFLNTENAGQSKRKVRKEWEEAVFKRDKGRFRRPEKRNSKRFVFDMAYLENVSFKGAYGLTERMFRGATVVGIDFRGTGIKRRALSREASRIIACRFSC